MSFESAIQPLLDCFCTALAEQGWEGVCCIHPGVPQLEMCCENGGQAWARLVRAYPSANFPSENPTNMVDNCVGAQQWALVVDVGAVRCVCDDLCDCAKKAENASNVLGDAEAGIKGLNCCFADDGACADVEYRLRALTIIGPDGGCGGFRVELLMAHTMNCCPPAEP